MVSPCRASISSVQGQFSWSFSYSRLTFLKSLNSCMDYRARGSWIGNVRGRLGKAGYGGSDVACILVCISSVMRVKAILAMRACYKYHKYVNCHKIFEIIESILNTHNLKQSNEANLLYAKALFCLFQKEQRSLSKFSYSIKKYRVLHQSCYSKAKEVIKLLGAAADGEYLDAEASKFLDLSMIAYVSETNNLHSCKRCVLCRKKTPLRRSHLWPESLLRLYKSGGCLTLRVRNGKWNMLK